MGCETGLALVKGVETRGGDVGFVHRMACLLVPLP